MKGCPGRLGMANESCYDVIGFLELLGFQIWRFNWRTDLLIEELSFYHRSYIIGLMVRRFGSLDHSLASRAWTSWIGTHMYLSGKSVVYVLGKEER